MRFRAHWGEAAPRSAPPASWEFAVRDLVDQAAGRLVELDREAAQDTVDIYIE
jgi:hypothetical protein